MNPLRLMSCARFTLLVECINDTKPELQASRDKLLQARILELEKENERLQRRLADRIDHIGLWENSEGIFSTIQIAHSPLEQNFKHLGIRPTAFWLEVGTNSQGFLVDEMDVEAFDRGVFLLSFEPLLDKYAFVLNRFGGGKAETPHPLGKQHAQSMIFPLAVGCSGSAQMQVTKTDGCSTLLMPRATEFEHDPGATFWEPWVGTHCLTTVDSRRVPCVTLEHIIGVWLGGREIEYMKIDAQGYDLSVVQSAGQHLNKLQVLTMEVNCDFAAKLYEGQPNCTSVYKEMRHLGFPVAFIKSCSARNLCLGDWTNGTFRKCLKCRHIRFSQALCRSCVGRASMDLTFVRRGVSLPLHLQGESLFMISDEDYNISAMMRSWSRIHDQVYIVD